MSHNKLIVLQNWQLCDNIKIPKEQRILAASSVIIDFNLFPLDINF